MLADTRFVHHWTTQWPLTLWAFHRTNHLRGSNTIMGTTNTAATIMTADILELNAIGDAIFAEWFPNYRPGDPVPPMPPAHIMQEARELAFRHRMIAARRRGQRAA
jgi:hypothetical protein